MATVTNSYGRDIFKCREISADHTHISLAEEEEKD